MSNWKKAALTKGLLAASLLIVGYGGWVTWNRIFEVEAEPKLTYKHLDGKSSSSNFLLEVPIYGDIMVDASDPSLFWSNDATYSVHVQKLLQQASEDKRVKGILLRLNTKGGSATGSEAIYEALVNYRKTTRKPIVAYIEEIAASGGVMSMMGTDAVYAAPGSTMGNIGIVGENLLVFDKASSYTSGTTGESVASDSGIERIVISAGKGKDLYHSYRKPTTEEMKILQKTVDNDYNRFVKLVSNTRSIPEKTIRETMGAYLFDNKQAETFKLIDGTKNHEEAIADLAKRANIGEDFRVVRAKEPKNSLFGGFGAPNTLTYEQKTQMLKRDRCSTTKGAMLLYYGNLKNLCS